ncbi:phenylacetate-CoA oxygenase subunit PaaJ [Paeniglutamicibacter psychrophenolicus]|uniref:Ring-1,2-phenylacetyl-CoA epoxidase subunit PaaD n=1 Tax=Paeniglutamicibacter psychrophenolicus TaxID=257454 RepID=A0ABS4WCF8_9MICC|nr:1,2-phenylacetyl-CoA epoxidase subunit PaaD [Paeniglutamicibacter psychrophenolicus]MBP2373877.1 ring-1,2-phenylacetyl-CoA epoxidase subunit PaaD [Paeniglutamicibacter psychrophenolicus]
MTATITELREIASRVTDPEIPVLTIADLGILRDVEMAGDTVVVTITPTYSGCPAMDAITEDLGIVFKESGYQDVRVNLVLSPAWSTDWMTESGKSKLQAYGIAPPTGTGHRGPVTLGLAVKCPQCHSLNTKELSRFGSTACKSMYQCKDCLEPFDYFKVLS